MLSAWVSTHIILRENFPSSSFIPLSLVSIHVMHGNWFSFHFNDETTIHTIVHTYIHTYICMTSMRTWNSSHLCHRFQIDITSKRIHMYIHKRVSFEYRHYFLYIHGYSAICRIKCWFNGKFTTNIKMCTYTACFKMIFSHFESFSKVEKLVSVPSCQRGVYR